MLNHLRKYPSNKIVYSHKEIWSVDLLDLNEFEQSNSKRCRYILVVIDNFHKNDWSIALNNKHSQITANDFYVILTHLKPSLDIIESDRGNQLSNIILQIFLKFLIIQHFSRYSHKRLAEAEWFNRSLRNILKEISLWDRKRWLVILTIMNHSDKKH